MKKKAVSLLLAFVLAFSLCACETYYNFKEAFFPDTIEIAEIIPDDTIKIGVFEPLTGDDSEAAAEEIRGIELAHKLYPEVLGKELVLVYADNESDDRVARQVAEELVGSGVSVVIGSYRNVLSLAGADVFAKARIPAIAVTCTNPLISQSSQYYSRVCLTDAYQGQSAARYALGRLNERWYTVFLPEGDDYAATLAEQFTSELAARLGNEYSVAVVSFPPGTSDFSLYLEKLCLMRTGPIFFPCDAELGQEVLFQAKDMGCDFKWIGCNEWAGLAEAALLAGRQDLSFLDGVSFVSDYAGDRTLSDTAELFYSAYAETYGGEVPSKNAALGFDAYLMAVEAIKRAGRPEAGTLIANKLINIRGFRGVTGTINMDSNGDPTKDVVINIIENGEYSAEYIVAPDWGE
ncbi:MAG TPA: ABC transporter substrate-binding protein [Bacillota bacterium]|nr:ABC transporter substrate-binding protein [Bacillota bacterium]